MCAIMEDVLLTESTISGIDVSAKVSDCAITVSRDALDASPCLRIIIVWLESSEMYG